MKRFIGWLEQRDRKRSTSLNFSGLENKKEIYRGYDAQRFGVDFVMRQYYGDYNH